ncbi:MAG: formylglycine-generating enzyme family protein [Candidatus Binatia bacterium]
MISADSENPLPEAELAALLHGLRYRGLVVGPDDAARVAAVFRHAQEWSHQRRVRVLKSLLARNDEERRVIDQLAPFLFVTAQRRVEATPQAGSNVSRKEADEPVQPRFSPRGRLIDKRPPHPVPRPQGERGPESERSKEYAKVHWRGAKYVSDVFALMLLAVVIMGHLSPRPQPVEVPSRRTRSEVPDVAQKVTHGPRKIPDTYEPPPPVQWPFWVVLSVSAIPLILVGPRFLRFRRQQFKINTLVSSTGPRTYRFVLQPEKVTPPLDANLVREAAFHLHVASAEAEAPWIDVRQTVEATVRNAGRLTLCFDTWREHRPVLFIEDCAPSMVRWPDVGRQIAQALGRQGGTVAHYYMDRTPERLFPGRDERVSVPLEQVLAGLGEPTIVLLSDAAAIDPFAASMKQAWIGSLAHAVWLHPQQAELWSSGSRWLADRLRVAALNDEGLLRLGTARGTSENVALRRWRPPQTVGQEVATRLAAIRASLGDETFWWLAAGAVLDSVDALTTRVWWHVCNDAFLPALPSRENCNRVWELPDVRVSTDGTVRLSSDLREALVEKLRSEQTEILERVVAWAEAYVQQDLETLAPQTLAAVEARAVLGRLQLLDQKRHQAARRTLKQLTRDGFGGWMVVNEREEGVLRRWRLSLGREGPLPRASLASLGAGIIGVVLASVGLLLLSPAQVIKVTLNAPATVDASGKVALSWVLQNSDEKLPSQWQVWRSTDDVQKMNEVKQTNAQVWQDSPTGNGPWRYQVLAFGSQGEEYRSDIYEVVGVKGPLPEIKGEMVAVPAGDFFMGCNEKVDNECFDNEKPGRTVNLPAFAIDKTEVTVAAYRQCVEGKECSEEGLERYGSCNWGKEGRENHPINCVDWNQAGAFCQWAGKRLPTEAEWEKAARGTDGRKYPWGDEWDGRKANVNGTEDGYEQTAPVSSFPTGASPYGALDMAGNVWEWTADWYDKEKKYRSLRGGSWTAHPQYARASDRSRNEPGFRNVDIGLRCAQ